MTIDPGLRLERVVQLNDNCFGIAVHSQRFYVSTSKTVTGSKKNDNKIEVTALDGEAIETIKLQGHETVDCLCVNTDATRIFCSCKRKPW